MLIIDDIHELVSELYEGGEEIAPFVILGRNAYRNIWKEFATITRNPYSTVGHITMTLNTTAGSLDIRLDVNKPADYIGINGRTILDIIAEEILLGEQ